MPSLRQEDVLYHLGLRHEGKGAKPGHLAVQVRLKNIFNWCCDKEVKLHTDEIRYPRKRHLKCQWSGYFAWSLWPVVLVNDLVVMVWSRNRCELSKDCLLSGFSVIASIGSTETGLHDHIPNLEEQRICGWGLLVTCIFVPLSRKKCPIFLDPRTIPHSRAQRKTLSKSRRQQAF